jgi:glucose/arabinose dehydrogenase
LDGDRVVGEERLVANLGERIRDIRQGPDEAIYFLTDDRSGRLMKVIPK